MMTEIPDNVPEQKRQLLKRLVNDLSQVAGMAAIALGGSYASITQHAASDLDIGLYYFESRPFSISDIKGVAARYETEGSPTVTAFYEWGAWVNGGAWIHNLQSKVDFLYRNLDQIQSTIKEAQQGISQHDYDQQPAYGFYSVIYLAETQICIPLYDPQGLIAKLKRQVEVYPPLLKEKVIANSLWNAEFTLLHGRGFAARGDVYNTVGCLTRAAANLTQALFALNECYFIRDKQVMETIAGFAHLPEGYITQVSKVLAKPGSTADELTRAIGELEGSWRSVVGMEGVNYTPQFKV
jgi:hypothetical protein